MPTRYSYGDSGNIGKFTETGALYARLFMTDGRRVKRGNVEFVYDDSGNLVKSDGMEFCYDESGVTGVKYNNKEYVYRKDAQGNIVAPLDDTYQVVVKYIYDAWGNHVVLNPDGSKNESSTFIGNVNPFRYRGYYYAIRKRDCTI